MSDNLYNTITKNFSKNLYASFKHPPYILERKLINCIKLMDDVAALNTLKEINNLEKANLSNNPLTSLKYSLVASCTIFTRAAIEGGLDSEIAFTTSDFFIHKIDNCNTVVSAQELESEMLIHFINMLRSKKDYIYSPLVNKTISFIKKNLDSKLSLDEISEHCNLHPNYISAIFSKEVGITITDFIQKERVEVIKTLLTESNISLKELSYIFNFNSQAHFSAFFKKKMGITPLKYRNMFTKNN